MLAIRTSKCNTIIKKTSSALFLWLNNSRGWFVGHTEVIGANGALSRIIGIGGSDRTLPVTLNLNTATETDLMTIPAVDLAVARKILSARRARGFFRSPDDLSAVLAPSLVQKFRSMCEQMKTTSSIPRP